MQCDLVQRNLNALLDGELSGWEKWRLERHFSRCAVCTAELAEIQKLSVRAMAWRNTEPSPALKSKIFAAVSARPQPARTQPRALFLSRFRMGKLAIGASLLILCLLFISGVSWFKFIENDPLEAIKRMGPAIEKVESAHLSYWITNESGNPIKQRELWYQSGSWLAKKSNQNVQLYHDRKLWQYNCQTQIVESLSAEGFPGRFINDPDFRAVRDSFLRPGAETVRIYKSGTSFRDGKELTHYMIENADSASEKTRLLVTKETATELPVTIEKQNLVGGEWTTGLRVEFEFNRKFPPEMFDIERFGEKTKMQGLCAE